MSGCPWCLSVTYGICLLLSGHSVVTGGAFVLCDGLVCWFLRWFFFFLGGGLGAFGEQCLLCCSGCAGTGGGVTGRCFHLSRLYLGGCVNNALVMLWLGLRGVTVCLLVSQC